ncbi:MAG: cyclic nucleotide-binding domain-containing protein, partial [Calditrichaeota bacterium]|nr:cyclic nucleotide-binding domain-containing protein [Calditrichota bacterium]
METKTIDAKNRQQIILELKNCPLFASVSNKDMDFIAECVEYRVYGAGEFLFHESMPRQGIYWIIEGEVEILKGIGDQPVRLTLLGDNTLLGERILLSSEIPHLTSAKTTKETRVIFLPKKYLHQIKQENAQLFEQLARIAGDLLAQRLASVKGLTPLEEKVRVEHDLLGERELPAHVLYGIQTQRAIENFPITGIPISNFPNLIKSLAMVKKAAALANHELGLLEEEKTRAISRACDEIIDGKHHQFFVVDVLQGGAGTSTNMNANEVIANRALEILRHLYGSYDIIHPNNHVNLSQSTNDAYPTAMRIGL